MLYNILVPFSQDFGLLNVFRYITFRSAGALIFALLFTILTGPWFLKKLAELKLGQPILEYVPEHMSKAGTPTMGGLLIMAGALLSTLLWADLANAYILHALTKFKSVKVRLFRPAVNGDKTVFNVHAHGDFFFKLFDRLY